jgi:hypothetical protein
MASKEAEEGYRKTRRQIEDALRKVQQERDRVNREKEARMRKAKADYERDHY